MQDKIVLITGATSGIGKQTAISLALLGATVIITGRNKEIGEKTVTEIQNTSRNNKIDLIIGDLSILEGVNNISKQFQEKYKTLDILINNAGSAATKFEKTKNGLETNFAVNVVAPFLLTKLLLQNLKNSSVSRVICLMGGDIPSKLELDNLQCEKEFKGLNSYSQSKLTMMTLMYEFSQQIKNEKTTINICYPGQASTNMTQSVTKEMLPKLMQPIFPIFKFMTKPDNGKSAKNSSKSSVYLATSENLNNKTGKYYNKKCKETEIPKCVTDEKNRKYIWNYVNKILAITD